MEYRILIVSENTVERNRYTGILNTSLPDPEISYKITSVSSVAAAQLQATRQRFDLVIVALAQHDDGLELSSRLKDLFPDMRLLLLCEHGITKSQLKTARMIRAGVAESTIDPHSLRAVVSDMLGASALLQQLQRERSAKPSPNAVTLATMPNVIEPFIQPFLEDLRRQTHAQVAIYCDKTGRIIARDGNNIDINITAIAVLIARGCGDYLELRQLIGDTAITHLSVHEGITHDIYATNVREDRFLALFFDKEYGSPKLGFVWLLMKRRAEQLSRVN